MSNQLTHLVEETKSKIEKLSVPLVIGSWITVFVGLGLWALAQKRTLVDKIRSESTPLSTDAKQ